MKTKPLFLILIIIIAIGSKHPESSPLEGAWQLFYAKMSVNDTLTYKFPGNTIGSQLKIWSGNHFLFSGRYKFGKVIEDNYGGGTYTLNGNFYEENLLYFSDSSQIGKSVKLIVEIKGDTLIQYYPATTDWKINKDKANVEKYVRLRAVVR